MWPGSSEQATPELNGFVTRKMPGVILDRSDSRRVTAGPQLPQGVSKSNNLEA